MAAPLVHAIPGSQLSRTALLYLLSAFSACIALLSPFMPWWIPTLAAGSLLWRLLVFTGRLSFPSRLAKVLLVVLAGAALFLQYRFRMSLDFFVALLLSGFSLKLLELNRNRDTQILLYLSFFVVMTFFLFQQLPAYALLAFLSVLLLLAALVAAHSDEAVLARQWWQPLKKAGALYALALPVMLFMFVVMPRVPPLWYMPLQKQQQARTGMSDSMSPGDVASLANSSELAFRATFEGSLPDRQSLYWYGAYLDMFDGTRWTAYCSECTTIWQRSMSRPVVIADEKTRVSAYQVILEPQGGKWVYVLNPSDIRDDGIWVNPDGMFRYARDVGQRKLYTANYWPRQDGVPAGQALPSRSRYVALPPSGNARAKALAQQWRNAAAADAAVVQSALDYYRAAFTYTLQPPLLGDERVDDFLFNTRSGFCEHFAGSFVFLMRAAGIPARVAIGYMGGETSPQDRYVIVRQYDAHAWAEVWLPERGWVLVDPTAAVAPERIDRSFVDAFSGNPAFNMDTGLQAYRHVPLLNRLRLQWQHVDYLWARWVLGYEPERQQALLRRFGLLSPWKLAGMVAVSTLLAFAVLGIFLYWRHWWSAHEHRATRLYRQLCHAYAVCGLERAPSETPLQFAGRVTAAGMPGAGEFAGLSTQYYCWCYETAAQALPPGFMENARRLQRLLLWHRFRQWLSGGGIG